MQKALISIEDWSGGNTLNKKMGKKNNSFRSFGLDLITRPGFLMPKQAYESVTGGTASQNILDMIYAITNGVTYLAIATKIFTLATPNTISAAHTVSTGENIQTLKEYLGKMYYAQSTKIGQFDLSATYNDTWNSILGTNHPIEVSADGFMYVGAGYTLDRWDNSSYSKAVLNLPMGWDIKTLANFGVTYLALGANFLGASGSTESKVFLWDRIAASWNDEIEIPEQTIYAMQYHKGGLWIWAGTTTISIYYVPLGSRTAKKVFTFENFLPNTVIPTVEVNAVTVKNGRIHFGYSSKTSASEQSMPAVYSFNPDPNNFQLQGEVLLSAISESGTDDILISCVRSIPSSSNPTIFISQNYGSTYSLVRQVESLSDPFSSSSSAVNLQTLYFEAPVGTKLYFEGFGIDTLKRPAGQITLEYMKDGETAWSNILDYSATNGIGTFKKFALEAYNIAFRISFSSMTGLKPFFLRRFYGTGKLVPDPR